MDFYHYVFTSWIDKEKMKDEKTNETMLLCVLYDNERNGKNREKKKKKNKKKERLTHGQSWFCYWIELCAAGSAPFYSSFRDETALENNCNCQ